MTTGSEPARLRHARSLLGTREIVGRPNTNALIAFQNSTRKWNGVTWKDDEMPWCGGFVTACLVAVGVEPVRMSTRAKSWASWGAGCGLSALPQRGDRLRSPRREHVGFHVGEDEAAYHVLGDNQGNSVLVTRNAKAERFTLPVPGNVERAAGLQSE